MVKHGDTIFAASRFQSYDILTAKGTEIKGFKTFKVEGDTVVTGTEECKIPAPHPVMGTIAVTDDYVYTSGSFNAEISPSRITRGTCEVVAYNVTALTPSNSPLRKNGDNNQKIFDLKADNSNAYTLSFHPSNAVGLGKLAISRFDKSMTKPVQYVHTRGDHWETWSGSHRMVVHGGKVWVHTKLGLESIPLNFETGASTTMEASYQETKPLMTQFGMNVYGNKVYSLFQDFHIYEETQNTAATVLGHATVFDLEKQTVERIDIRLPSFTISSKSEAYTVLPDKDGNMVAVVTGNLNDNTMFATSTRMQEDAWTTSIVWEYSPSDFGAEFDTGVYGVIGSGFHGSSYPVNVGEGRILVGGSSYADLNLLQSSPLRKVSSRYLGEVTKPYNTTQYTTCDTTLAFYCDKGCEERTDPIPDLCRCLKPTQIPSDAREIKITTRDVWEGGGNIWGDSWESNLVVRGGFCDETIQHITGYISGGGSLEHTIMIPGTTTCLEIEYVPDKYTEENFFEVTSVGWGSTGEKQGTDAGFVVKFGPGCPASNRRSMTSKKPLKAPIRVTTEKLDPR